ncbi:MAG TPA: hypothetical protein DCZ92_02970 [Elusimicrobia bacterium]|nr:hypothetical protein [Elusimicrobiota bacterium]
MEITYRTPCAADEEEIMRLLTVLYQGHVGEGLRGVLSEFIRDDNYFKMLATDGPGGPVAGFMTGSCRLEVDFECRAGIIEELIVPEEYRKRGIAKTMVAAFEDWSRARGAKGTLVPCGRPGFYEAMSFEKYMVPRYWKEFK